MATATVAGVHNQVQVEKAAALQHMERMYEVRLGLAMEQAECEANARHADVVQLLTYERGCHAKALSSLQHEVPRDRH